MKRAPRSFKRLSLSHSSESKGKDKEVSQAGVLSLVFSALFFLALSLFLIWTNIERTKLAYNLDNLRSTLDARLELKGKLLVERDFLLSPYQLGSKARSLGLQSPATIQTRRMTFDTNSGDK